MGFGRGRAPPQYKIINKCLHFCSWSPFTYNGNLLRPLISSRPATPLKPTRRLEEAQRCVLPQRGSGQIPAAVLFAACISMLAKHISLQYFWLLVFIAMSGKMRANPGSGRIWNLIVGIFRWGRRPTIAQEIFVGVYSLSSTVDSNCCRTVPGHCYGSNQQLQQRQVSKCLPTTDHPRNAVRNYGVPVTTSESECVFKLQRTLTSICSTIEERLQALLLLQCHHDVHEHCPTPDDVLRAFAEKARLLNFVLYLKLLKLYM